MGIGRYSENLAISDWQCFVRDQHDANWYYCDDMSVENKGKTLTREQSEGKVFVYVRQPKGANQNLVPMDVDASGKSQRFFSPTFRNRFEEFRFLSQMCLGEHKQCPKHQGHC
jgi:hypothetical protein